MKKLVWMAVVVAGLALLACSSSNSKGNGGSFPYSGPSCQGGQPGTTTLSAACLSCVESACPTTASQTTCINSTCSGFYNCYCACQATDTACQSGCAQMQSSACSSCMMTGNTCSTQAVQSCASQCLPDAGFFGGGDASNATGSCATLVTCCASTAGAPACNTVASMNNQTACQLFLSGLQDAGICH